MKTLFVEKSIHIYAPASIVWDVLTLKENTDQWAVEFSVRGDRVHIESDWLPGSPVFWVDKQGQTIVEGHVLACKKDKFLRFTVFDVRQPRVSVTEKDGITYEMDEVRGKTCLSVTQGDFSVVANGKKYRDSSAKVWDKVLIKVKNLAESQAFDVQKEERKYLIGS